MSHPSSTWTLLVDPEAVASVAGGAFDAGIDYKLDANGDLDLSTGDIEFTTGLSAIAQGLRQRLLTVRGEWFLDLDHGVPYLERDGVDESEALIGAKFNETRARSAFREIILETPGVTELRRFSITFNRSTRVMSLDLDVRTTFGIIQATEEI